MNPPPSDVNHDWFRDWFGDEYLELYPHRDSEEAAAAVRLFLRVAYPPPGTPVLDLACGAGRHLQELRAAGLQAAGLDLSAALLHRARTRGLTRLVRADMRELPFADGAFGGVTSFFTSFGYFTEPEEDEAAVREMRRVLVAGGSFLLDFLNADRVTDNLVPEDVRSIPRGRVRQRRSIRDGVVIKHIRVEPADGSPVREFVERVRLYEACQLETLLASCGLRTTDRFGDYGGERFTSEAPRLVLAGRAL